ncbi:fibronectin type III domain-containing protein [Hymenobacter coccineus]|uniref:fibronectin type III domain-containing protein n=1 Tax=Hymenobacter coccineus TaxID=1908235 RepID=UPI000F7A968F|nr:fibronectin type III domain-containing protein [Hymenobacter coccineus]
MREFVVLRTAHDKRSAWLKWAPVSDTYAYNIRVGIAPNKLYHSILVHSQTDYYFKGMNKDLPYHFTIEAVNENGPGPATKVQDAP